MGAAAGRQQGQAHLRLQQFKRVEHVPRCSGAAGRHVLVDHGELDRKEAGGARVKGNDLPGLMLERLLLRAES